MKREKIKLSYAEMIKKNATTKKLETIKKKTIKKKIYKLKKYIDNPQTNFDIKYFDNILDNYSKFQEETKYSCLLKKPNSFVNYYYLILDSININDYFEEIEEAISDDEH